MPNPRRQKHQYEVHEFRLAGDEVLSGSGLRRVAPFTAHISYRGTHRLAVIGKKNKASLAFCCVHCGGFDESVTLKMHVPHTFSGL